MDTFTDEVLIENCKKLVEEKTGWGKSENWSSQDFGELSQQIFEATGVTLSVTTLKRIWGKVKYESAPTVTTLNTLARFVGFEHWRAFRQIQFSENAISIPEDIILVRKPVSAQEATLVSSRPRKSYLLPMTIVGLFLLTAVVGYLSLSKANIQSKAQSGIYRFASRKMLNVGVPNSVVFDYDASGAPVDSIFIQQSWDKLLSTRVPKNQTQHTSIYYYPGFFQAKLRVGNQVVKEHNVFIKTDGWLSMIEQKPVPVYFKKDEVTKNDLSGFGVNFNEFVKVRLEVLNGNAKFYINNKLAYHIEGGGITSKIIGITYRFKGTGSVDWVKLMKADGMLVYEDEF